MKKVKLLFVSLLGVFFMHTTFADGGYQVGDTADDFSLKNVDGSMVSLMNIPNAKGFIVVFTCNHCPYSKAYEDRIIELHKEFSPKGYPVVAINSNDATREPQDSYENMQKRAKEKQFPFAYLHDETQEIAKKYGAVRTPHVYVLSKQKQTLKVEYIGAIDNNTRSAAKADKKYVSDVIKALMKNQKPTKTTTKAIGCGIKWRKS